ncbi:nitroreductase/quinone reductase family protein [Streptomyces sp. NPDC046716]|uniref:nitroreductase/quinone reductase family protein n=1 Tax=Streptomyces sp. NPDC046716 TaxID=3157093 RepID=UPI0033FE1F52
MARDQDTRHRLVTAFQRKIVNPVTRRLPGQMIIETTGRVSGQPRRTPVGGRRIGDTFWLVSEFGLKSQYVRNIQVSPDVRVRIRGRWYHGVAHLVPEDDARARLRRLPLLNSTAVRAFGDELLTIRVDLA